MTHKYSVRPSDTMAHYVEVASIIPITYGRTRTKWKDTLCTRLRLGYKYYWELGTACTEEDTKCKINDVTALVVTPCTTVL